MKLETLNEFVVIAKHLSFTKAAAELYTSQPALSSRIGAMEKELGYPLFERTRSKVVLTEAGSVFLEYAQKILGCYDEALEKGRAVASEQPALRISSVNLSSPVYKNLLRQKIIKYTFVDLGINTNSIEALQNDLIDLSINVDYSILERYKQEAEELGLRYFEIGEGNCVIHLMKTHPLATKKSLCRKDLDGQDIVIHSGSHFDTWSNFVQWIVGDDIKLTFRMNHIESVSNLSLVDFGESIYICGGDSSRQILEQRDDIVTFDTLDGKPMSHPIALVCRIQDIEAGLPIEAFIAELLK